MRIFSAVFLALATAACAGTPEMRTGPVAVAAPAGTENFGFSGAGTLVDAVLRPSDTISVVVAGETDLSLPEVRVGQDGLIMMPAIGKVQVAGRTTEEISGEIESRLAESYLREPRVAVNIVNAASRFVTVEGAVQDPGVFTYEPNVTLLGAIAMADGPSNVAKEKQVVLFRTIDGQPMAARFDLNQLRTGAVVDPVILPQDRVVVGVSGSSRAFQDILRALPILGIFRPF